MERELVFSIIVASIILVLTSINAGVKDIDSSLEISNKYIIDKLNSSGLDDLESASCKSEDYFHKQGENGNLSFLGLYIKSLRNTDHYFGNTPNPDIKKIEDWLMDNQLSNLWGYGIGYICTATDSAYVLEGLIDNEDLNLENSIDSLLKFQTIKGVVPQLCNVSDPCSMGLGDRTHFWCQEDVQTTAHVTYILKKINQTEYSKDIEVNTKYLIKNQEGDGSWLSYWIPNPYYSTYLVLRVVDDSGPTQKALQFIIDTQNSDGSWGEGSEKALSTASAVLALSEKGYTGKKITDGVEWLLRNQNEDGSWDGGTIVSYSQLEGSELDLVLCEDKDNLFTTSLTILALVESQEIEDSNISLEPNKRLHYEKSVQDIIELTSNQKIQSYNTKTYDVIVVGGGLSGLSTVYEVKDYDVLLLEKTKRLGGRVDTIYINNTNVDLGAIFAISPGSVPFEFDTPEIIVEGGPIGIYFENSLVLCESVLECLDKLGLSGSERGEILRYYNSSISVDELNEESYVLVNSLFKTINPGEIKDYLPQIQKTAFTRFYLGHYVNGNSVIVDEFVKRIKAEVSLESIVTSVEDKGGEVKVIFEKDGKEKEVYGKTVVVATPGNVAKWIVKSKNSEYSEFLDSLRYGTFTVVALGVPSGYMGNFSYIMSHDSPFNIISKWSGNDIDSLIIYYGDKESQEIYNLPDDEVISLTIDEINEIGIGYLTDDNVVFKIVKRWKNGGTIISPESYGSWSEEKIRPSERIFLAGDYTWQEMPYGMDAAIKSGKVVADKVKEFLESEQ
jgi:protoporphyrinogen oxidase